MSVRAVVFALAFLAACGEPQPWGESIPTTLDLRLAKVPSEVALLQPFDLRLDLFWRQDLEVEFSPEVPTGTMGTVRLEPERELAHGRWRRAWLHLRATEGPRELVIAPFRARSKDGTAVVQTDEVRLQVTSLLAAASGVPGADPAAVADDVEIPGPLLAPPMPQWPWWVGALALIVLAAAIRWWQQRRSRPRPAMSVALEPPHQKALRELQRLRARPRRTEEEVADFYVATSHVLRVYLEERFGLRAPERTTEEFLAEVEAGGPLSVAQCIDLRRFLQQCDLVKFASHVPPEDQHLQTLLVAELLVEATRSDRAATTVGGAA